MSINQKGIFGVFFLSRKREIQFLFSLRKHSFERFIIISIATNIS